MCAPMIQMYERYPENLDKLYLQHEIDPEAVQVGAVVASHHEEKMAADAVLGMNKRLLEHLQRW